MPICKSCINKAQLEFSRTLQGKIKNIYYTQRKNSKSRGMLIPDYTKKEFKDWCMDNGFYALWCQWHNSGYLKEFSPSPDRKDDYKPYSLSNLRLVTWKINNDKCNKDERNGINRKRSKKIKQYEEGVLIKHHYSIRQASRETGVEKADISKCCHKKRISAGGFTWEFA